MNRPYRSSSGTFRTSPVSHVLELSIYHYSRGLKIRLNACYPKGCDYFISPMGWRWRKCLCLVSGHLRQRSHRVRLQRSVGMIVVMVNKEWCVQFSGNCLISALENDIWWVLYFYISHPSNWIPWPVDRYQVFWSVYEHTRDWILGYLSVGLAPLVAAACCEVVVCC